MVVVGLWLWLLGYGCGCCWVMVVLVFRLWLLMGCDLIACFRQWKVTSITNLTGLWSGPQHATFVGSENVFEPDLDPKNSPNGPKKITLKGSKSEKRPKIWPNLKQKDRAVLPKQKLIVYISRFQKCFLT